MKEMQNYQIPSALFDEIVSFFCYLKFSNHSFPGIYDVHGIFSKLMEKQQRVNLRKSYENIIFAKDGKQRRSAMADYACIKRGGASRAR